MKDLEKAIDFWRDEIDQTRLDYQGRYPADINSDMFPGYVIIATLDHDNEPCLKIYTAQNMIDAYNAKPTDNDADLDFMDIYQNIV